MQHAKHKVTMGRQRYRSGILATAVWLLPAMAMLGVGSFMVARSVVAPRVLKPTTVHDNRPQPVRILSPDEARAMASDEPSRVWTEGVRESDIPKLDSDNSSRDRDDSDRERRRVRRPRPAATAPQPDSPKVDTTPVAPTDGTDVEPTAGGDDDAPPPRTEPSAGGAGQ